MKNRINILDIPIDRVDFLGALKKIEELVGSGGYHQVATINPEFIMHAQKDEEFKKALLHSSLNTPDGIGILWAAKYNRIKNKELRIKNLVWLAASLLAIIFYKKWLTSELKERVTGIDLMWEIANRAQERGWKVFLLGGEEGVAEEVAKRLKSIYPRLNIVGTYAGSPEEKGMVEKIAEVKPDILFVAYGSPKQEKFIYKNLEKLKAKVTIGVGGSFDFIIQRAKRAPLIFQKLGLEWLWRFIHQPRRAKRIFNAFPYFVWRVLRER